MSNHAGTSALELLPNELVQSICNVIDPIESFNIRLVFRTLYRKSLYLFGKYCSNTGILSHAKFTTARDSLEFLLRLTEIPELRDRIEELYISVFRLPHADGWSTQRPWCSDTRLEQGELGWALDLDAQDKEICWRCERAWDDHFQYTDLLAAQNSYDNEGGGFRVLVKIFHNLKDSRKLESITFGSLLTFLPYHPHPMHWRGVWYLPQDIRNKDFHHSREITWDALDNSGSHELVLSALKASGLKGKGINFGAQGLPRYTDPVTLDDKAVTEKFWEDVTQEGITGLFVGDCESSEKTPATTEWLSALVKSATSIQTLFISGSLPPMCHRGPFHLTLPRAFTGTTYPRLRSLTIRDMIIERTRLGRFIRYHGQTLTSVSLQTITLIEGSVRKLVPALESVSNLERLELKWIIQRATDPFAQPRGLKLVHEHVWVQGKNNVAAFLRVTSRTLYTVRAMDFRFFDVRFERIEGVTNQYELVRDKEERPGWVTPEFW